MARGAKAAASGRRKEGKHSFSLFGRSFGLAHFPCSLFGFKCAHAGVWMLPMVERSPRPVDFVGTIPLHLEETGALLAIH